MNVGFEKNKIFKDVIATAALLTLVYMYLIHFLGTDLSRIFGDLGDARFNNYILEHGYLYLKGLHQSFWSPPFFFPAQNVLAYSDNHIGTLPFYALFRFFGNDIETSYQQWMILMFLLNAASCFVVLRWMKFNILGSFVGAALFTLAAPVMLQVGHIQLIPRFMIPFIFYSLLRYVETVKVKYFFWFCITFVYQFYIAIYMGFFSLLAILILLPLAVSFIRKKYDIAELFHSVRYLSKIGFISLVSLILLFVLFEPYIALKHEFGGRSWGEVSSMLPRISSWFYTSGGPICISNTIGNSLPLAPEHWMFLGVVPYTLLGGLLYVYYSKYRHSTFAGFENLVYPALLSISAIFLITLSFHGLTLYKVLIYWLPGFDAIRGVTRIILFLTFPFAVLVAFGLTKISRLSISAKQKIVFLGLIITLGFAEQYRGGLATYSKEVAQNRYMEIVKKIDKKDDFDVFYLKKPKPSPTFYADEIDAMFVSLMINRPTINGYSGNIPRNYNLYSTNSLISWACRNENKFKGLRVLVIGNEKKIINNDNWCSFVTNKDYLPSELNNIRYKLRINKISSNKIFADFQIINHGAQSFAQQSLKGHPLRISWRFLDESKMPLSGWNERMDLPDNIPAKGNLNVFMTIPFIAQHNLARYLQVSLVQEGVFWLHDIGVKPVETKLP